MPRRIRTTKKLARRIDLQYFTRPHAFRRWRLWLSVAIPALALGWLLTQRVQGNQKAYSSGPLSRSHAVFTQQCNLCHLSRVGAFSKAVTDDACLTCHDAPVHQENQTFTPSCSSCHLEHRGAMRLAVTSDNSCAQCHSRLEVRNGKLHYTASIHSFGADHPEFEVLLGNKVDPSQIRLNHYLHMQPNLIGPQNRRVQMTCDDCHRTLETSQSWPYAGEAKTPSALLAVRDSKPNTASGMAPIRFASHCAGCHTLQFDRKLGDEQVPHDTPQVVHAFVTKQLQDYIAMHPAEIHKAEPPNRQLPERMRLRPIANNAAEWVQFRVEEAEWLLWTKTCKQCHTLIQNDNALPAIAKSNITERWLPHAEFDHQSHRMISCESCHTKARTSHDSSDILVASIKTCQQCHRESSARDTAESRCFECHEYHDWTKARRTKGRFTIPELRGTAELQMPR
jgi:hypothetical protein